MTPVNIMTQKGKHAVLVTEDHEGNCFSVKTVQANQKLHSPPGIAYDVQVIKRAEELGVRYHVVDDEELGCKWSVDHALFVAKRDLMNRGHGWQFLLEMKYWTLGPTPRSAIREEIEESHQLSLFGNDQERAA